LLKEFRQHPLDQRENAGAASTDSSMELDFDKISREVNERKKSILHKQKALREMSMLTLNKLRHKNNLITGKNMVIQMRQDLEEKLISSNDFTTAVPSTRNDAEIYKRE
jgi:hypothetical protein